MIVIRIFVAKLGKINMLVANTVRSRLVCQLNTVGLGKFNFISGRCQELHTGDKRIIEVCSSSSSTNVSNRVAYLLVQNFAWLVIEKSQV